MKWYSLFSHTGKETENLVRQGCMPLELAITNNRDYRGSLPCEFRYDFGRVNDFLTSPGLVRPGSLITLNGYMGVLPGYVLEYLDSIHCQVYNIHPAPIQVYPELRGKDPQERLYEGLRNGTYGYIGAVIHKVDTGVDTGEIVHQKLKMPPVCFTKEDIYRELHELGTQMWVEFFEERMYDNG